MRIGLGLGILLMLLAFAALFVIVLLPTIDPENPFALNLLQSLACDPGQKAKVEVIVTRDSDGTGYTPYLTCIGREGERIDASGKHFGIGMISFAVPFLIGLFMTIVGAQRRSRPSPQTMWKEGSVPQEGFSTGVAAPRTFTAASTTSGATTFKAKLKELEEARDAGLISSEEYDRLRQEILDKLV